jgi:hypothetical protein
VIRLGSQLPELEVGMQCSFGETYPQAQRPAEPVAVMHIRNARAISHGPIVSGISRVLLGGRNHLSPCLPASGKGAAVRVAGQKGHGRPFGERLTTQPSSLGCECCFPHETTRSRKGSVIGVDRRVAVARTQRLSASPAIAPAKRHRLLGVAGAPRFWVFAWGDGFAARACEDRIQVFGATAREAIDTLMSAIRQHSKNCPPVNRAPASAPSHAVPLRPEVLTRCTRCRWLGNCMSMASGEGPGCSALSPGSTWHLHGASHAGEPDGRPRPSARTHEEPAARPDGHFNFPHLWPLKLPQAGRVRLWVFGPLGVDRDARGRGLP